MAQVEPVFSFSKSHMQYLDESDVDWMKKHITEFLTKYPSVFPEPNVSVYIKMQKEVFREMHKYDLKIHVSTVHGNLSTHATEFGVETALGKALHNMKRQVEKIKSQKIVKEKTE